MQIDGKWWVLGRGEELDPARTQQLEIEGGRALLHRSCLRTGRVRYDGRGVVIEFPPTLADVDGQDGRAWTRLLIVTEGSEPPSGHMHTAFTGIDDPSPWGRIETEDVMVEAIWLQQDPRRAGDEVPVPVEADEIPWRY